MPPSPTRPSFGNCMEPLASDQDYPRKHRRWKLVGGPIHPFGQLACPGSAWTRYLGLFRLLSYRPSLTLPCSPCNTVQYPRLLPLLPCSSNPAPAASVGRPYLPTPNTIVRAGINARINLGGHAIRHDDYCFSVLYCTPSRAKRRLVAWWHLKHLRLDRGSIPRLIG
jgi:hypothetical protein